MKTSILIAALSILVPIPASARTFGEGYTSAEPGGHADVRFRAFSVPMWPQMCDESPRPVELRVLPNPIVMSIGDRIHRSNVTTRESELIIEAYGQDGEFQPQVPITISTTGLHGILDSRSDWDYMEAVATGEDELVVSWICDSGDGAPVQARVPMIVR